MLSLMRWSVLLMSICFLNCTQSVVMKLMTLMSLCCDFFLWCHFAVMTLWSCFCFISVDVCFCCWMLSLDVEGFSLHTLLLSPMLTLLLRLFLIPMLIFLLLGSFSFHLMLFFLFLLVFMGKMFITSLQMCLLSFPLSAGRSWWSCVWNSRSWEWWRCCEWKWQRCCRPWCSPSKRAWMLDFDGNSHKRESWTQDVLGEGNGLDENCKGSSCDDPDVWIKDVENVVQGWGCSMRFSCAMAQSRCWRCGCDAQPCWRCNEWLGCRRWSRTCPRWRRWNFCGWTSGEMLMILSK